MRARNGLFAGSLLALLAAPAFGGDAGGAAAAPLPTAAPETLELRVDPLMNLHAWVRRMAEGKEPVPEKPGAAEAVASARRIGEELGGFLGWGLLDGLFVGSDNTATLAKALPDVEESIQLRNGRTFGKRSALAELLAAYAKMEPWFLESEWPAWKKTLDVEARELGRTFLPKLPAAWADVEKHLDLRPPRQAIPVYLVHAAPFPGAVTQWSETGPFSWVQVGDDPVAEKEEAFLHESLHALDMLTPEGTPSVLSRLRDRLQAIPGSSAREVHDFVHTLMFVQAAGTVRVVYDPKHRDYGDVAGYYPKVPRATAVVVPAWRSYLKGEISREAALDRIAQGFAASLPARAKGGPEAAPKTDGERK